MHSITLHINSFTASHYGIWPQFLNINFNLFQEKLHEQIRSALTHTIQLFYIFVTNVYANLNHLGYKIWLGTNENINSDIMISTSFMDTNHWESIFELFVLGLTKRIFFSFWSSLTIHHSSSTYWGLFH